MAFEYQETTEDLATRINIHEKYGKKDIDKWMLGVLLPEKGSSILDVGCGAGKQLKAFHQYLEGEAEITGGDISDELLDQARDLNAELGDPFTILTLDFNKPFKFEDDSFDLLSCCFAIYYAADIPFTIKEMHRVLKPGGRLFSTGPMPENKQLFYDVIKEATGNPIESLKPFMDYTRASLSEDRLLWKGFFEGEDEFEQVMSRIRDVAQRKLEGSEGGLVMTKVVGGFMAHK